ncbi:flagellar hook-basal body protein [Xylanibacillus composti]|uniref:Flagellar basal-body rod protein FlgF n=1 Tax=Xylanibacillus composti TaxID=1572762 RepID=A0A8J4H4J3_9BACL|nr:flagellar hook-basal body protein [Xylanibacillus composti]MDT9725969.1 flagellar hook-basal body protein [Xylanibacillus composti]GIQ70877.1 flagellar basal-body rod protein FlgF [Xylanibacillus composti]
MLRGLYTAASGLTANQRRHDTITNNIANLNTPGYKQVTAASRSFPEMLIALTHGQQSTPIGRINTGVFIEENLPLFTQGDLIETANSADFAIVSNIRVAENVGGELVEIAFDESGKGLNQAGQTVYQPQAFFTLRNDAGEERYTRIGKFMLNGGGELVTLNGNRLIGRTGEPITFAGATIAGLPDEEQPVVFSLDQIKVESDGSMYDANTGLAILDQAGNPMALRLAQVDNPYRLIREGDGNYRLDEGEVPPQQVQNLAQISIEQGFIERSNVDSTQSMIDLMAAQRAYEANQRMVQYYDRSLEKAVNEIGRV